MGRITASDDARHPARRGSGGATAPATADARSPTQRLGIAALLAPRAPVRLAAPLRGATITFRFETGLNIGGGACVFPGMNLKHVGVAAAVLGAMACPQGTPLANGGLFLGNGGATATDVLSFNVQPSTVAARNIMTPAVQVTARDTLGNVDTGFSSPISVAIGFNPVGGNLSGTASVAPVNGVASFGDLRIDKSGSGYTLVASATSATSAGSTAFNVTAATASAPAR
jgi:hypothetical protein